MLKILIVEGNTAEGREQMLARDLPTQSGLYQSVLESLDTDLECHIAFPADANQPLPSLSDLKGYDGIAWTGSALNIYDHGPAIDNQIDFMKTCFAAQSLIFGSCWGLQVATVATGGQVAANEKGREIGIARKIKVNEAGSNHALYSGKSDEFDAVAVHLDHVVELPEGATVLSSNAISQVQAVEIIWDGSTFWGVQYHPEFDLEYIAGILRKYGTTLVVEGFCESDSGLEEWASDFETVQGNPERHDLAAKHNLGTDVTDNAVRWRELSNWLQFVRSEKSKLGSSSVLA